MSTHLHPAPNIDDIPAEIGGRIRKWADLGSEFGIDGNRIATAVRTAGSPGRPAWVATMTTLGDETYARDRPMEASYWYFMARFPHVLSPAAARAYDRHVSAYLAAARDFEHPLEEVRIPFEDSTFPAYLRLPRHHSGNLAAVVMWGGMDVWKSDLEIHLQAEQLLRLGISVLQIDLPGTGESPVPMSPTAERVPLAAIDFLRNHPAINETRIAVWGLSFGGYLAVKLAALLPDLAGAVNNGGPVHHALTHERFHRLPQGARITLTRLLALDPSTAPATVADRVADLSLITLNLLPTHHHAPLLSINGELDDLIPIEDLYVISEQGIRQDRMIYGTDIHVAGRNWRHHHPLTAAWLAAKTNA
ncbi:alpha/beta fold hydrolase [Nocardia sp. 2]|uniref:Alpha/beta fold hydrolase n=1 Tax=Nocardia acididurans TaxID=2802282 RepID=A0ABS1ME92_9NOCA|nr:alpha/beta fold hydrolase [Nocardia acididurans]MBL1078589.1 alpha/beta fold hydrolase [Nocardia acididurans]